MTPEQAAALTGLAVAWGAIVSVVINMMDSRKAMETWHKVAWALGLCLMPFVMLGAVTLYFHGLDNWAVDLNNAVGKGMECYGGAFAGHTGQKLAQKKRPAVKPPADATGAVGGSGGAD